MVRTYTVAQKFFFFAYLIDHSIYIYSNFSQLWVLEHFRKNFKNFEIIKSRTVSLTCPGLQTK